MSGTSLKLNFLLWSDVKPAEHISSNVTIEPDEDFAALRRLIKLECPHRLADVDPGALSLWKSSIPLDENLEENLKTIRFDVDNPTPERLNPWSQISHSFPTGADPETLHILALVPGNDDHSPDFLTGWSNKRKRPADDPIEKWKAKQQKCTLPDKLDLLSIIQEPLTEDEKVPIPIKFYYGLITTIGADRCTEDDISKIFRIGEMDEDIGVTVFHAIRDPPPLTGTGSAFIYFWDANIRCILERLLPNGKSIRNSNQHTLSRLLRPDFGFLLRKICVFRGEEKGPEDTADLKAELVDKLFWKYDGAPYMLGYYSTGSEVTLVAITAPTGLPGSKPVVHDLISTDLKFRRNRIANVCYLINLSSILAQLPHAVQSPADDFELFEGVTCNVEITNTVVVKTYTCPDAAARVKHLYRIYQVITDNSIPNTDEVVRAQGNFVHLYPRGNAWQPTTTESLRDCLVCLLEALVIAHQVPLFHRDIRWNNVICRVDNPSKWFLIDWEDASGQPTKAQPTFSKTTHAPSVFQDNHGAEVDVWGIGYLITSCTARGISPELKALGPHICEIYQTLTANDTLELVRASI